MALPRLFTRLFRSLSNRTSRRVAARKRPSFRPRLEELEDRTNPAAPIITSDYGLATALLNIAENLTPVTTVTATDADPGTTLTYSISGGADAAKFQINPGTGALRFATAPNFEAQTDSDTNNTYEVTVQVSDGSLTDTQAISVTVGNVNEPFSVSSGDLTLLPDPAGPQLGAFFGYSVAADTTFYVVGAPNTDVGAFADAGVVYVYDAATRALVTTLSNPTPAANDQFGYSVAVSGNIVVVGAPFDDTAGIDSGRAYVFDATTGNQIGSPLFHATTSSGDQFGHSVAVSGNTVVVGAHLDDTVANESGQAYLFNATTGAAIGSPLANPSPFLDDQFGYSVAISGNTVVVGAISDDTGQVNSGRAYLFNATTGAAIGTPLSKSVPAGGDHFGNSVSISGNIVVVGALFDDTGAGNGGRAYIFNASTGGLPIAMLDNPTPLPDDLFGNSVSVSGNTVVVGTRLDDTGASNSGQAYLFNATTGAQIGASLANPAPGAGDEFGYSVAISGNNVVVGIPLDDSGAADGGQAFVFNATTGGLPIAPLVNPTPASDDQFGYSVAVSGNTMVVGAASDDTGATDSGQVYVFNTTTGALSAALANPTPANGDQFGISVAVSGNTVVVGASSDDTGFTNSGQVYVFNATTGGPPIQTLANPSAAVNDGFGSSVAVSGNIVVVGAPQDDTGGTDSGQAYVFNATTGALIATLLNPTPLSEDLFGYSVSVSGNTVVVGAYSDDTGATNSGRVYVFDATMGGTPAPIRTLAKTTPASGDLFGYSVSVSGNTIVVGAAFDDAGATDSGQAYVFNATTGGPPIATLINPTAASGDLFGYSVSVSGNMVVVGAAFDDIGDSGQAYVFNATSGDLIATLANPTPATEDKFGYSVSMSGNTVLVGARFDDTLNFDQSAAYLFGGFYEVTENQTTVGTLQASDPDVPAQTLTWSKTGGADEAKFQINSNTGALSFITAPDFENPTDVGANNVYNVIVQVADGNGGIDTQALTITVLNVVDEIPPVVTTTTFLTTGTLAANVTSLAVTFSEPVVGANVPSNYQLQRAGADGLLGSGDDPLVTITSANVSSNTATLNFSALPEDVYRLTVKDAITDSTMNPLDGDNNGTAGGNWVRDFVVNVGLVVPYRWKEFSSYDQNYGWIMANAGNPNGNAAMFGGVTPQQWGDGNGLASQMSTDPAVLATLFTNKGYAGANAMLQAETWLSYSSTNSKHYAALFQVQNSTGSAITWTPSFYYTAYSGWNERASVAINGVHVWQSPGDHGSASTQTLSILIPANSTSTIIFVSASDSPSGNARTNALGFYNNSLVLPTGLTFVDQLPTPAVYRWQEFSSYDQNYGWIMGNAGNLNGNAAMFGGVTPQQWGDGNGLASQMSTDPAVLATLFTNKGYAGANAMLQAETWLSYSSTNSKHYAALFQVQNSTGSAITWTPSFYYTAYSAWGERASVAINGVHVWQSPGDHGSASTQTLSILIPANSTSTIIFVSASDAPSGNARTNALGFYNNSLVLPTGLTFVDQLPTPAVYRWQEFSSYDQNYGWIMGNAGNLNGNAAMFGGVTPQQWGDGNGLASQMSTDPAVLATLFTNKGYAGANAMLQAETWLSYSSTNSKHYAALFQVQNSTGSAITWTPSFYYTAYSAWGERASVAINGVHVWQSPGDHGSASTQTLSILIPANSTSTIIFVSASDAPSGNARTNALGFYNNSLVLPTGLTFVDDLTDSPAFVTQSSPGGFQFDVMSRKIGAGQLIQGSNNAFDGLGRLRVGNTDFYPVGDAISIDGGRTVATSLQTLAGLTVSRNVTVPNSPPGSENFARTVDVFSNATASPISSAVTVVGNLGSDAATTVFATSDGDLLVEATDLWFGTDDADGTGTPAVIHLLHGPIGLAPTAVQVTGDNVEWTYNVTVAPGETKRLASFTVLGTTRSQAVAAANALVTPSGFGGQAAAFLSPGEITSIANFQFNTAPSITSNGSGAAASINVAENSTAVTTVTATDPNVPPQTLTYSIDTAGGADHAKFSIGASSAALTFNTAPNFEAPTDVGGTPGDNTYLVTVKVSDGAGGIDTQLISVTVTDVVEVAPPTVTSIGANVTGIIDADWDANEATITTLSAHGLAVGESITIAGMSVAGYNGSFTVGTVLDSQTFTYAVTGPLADDASGGTVTGDASNTQRSRMTSIRVAFSALLDTTLLMTAGAFKLEQVNGNFPAYTLTNGVSGGILVSTATVNGHTEVTLTFDSSVAGVEFGSLADGNWTLTIDKDFVKTQSGAVFMAADEVDASSIQRLYGDVDGDGVVDINDLTPFGTTFGSAFGDDNFLAAFDIDESGTIDINDLTEFGGRFGLSL